SSFFIFILVLPGDNYALLLHPSTFTILWRTISLIASLAAPRYCLGSKASGFSVINLRTVAVMASLRSESIFILHTAMEAAFLSISSGTPLAPGILPPYLLIISTYFCGTED